MNHPGIATIHRALELGVTMLDTADVYGPHANEELIGKALRGRREGVVVATKFGIVRGTDPLARGVDGRPEYVRADGSYDGRAAQDIDMAQRALGADFDPQGRHFARADLLRQQQVVALLGQVAEILTMFALGIIFRRPRC